MASYFLSLFFAFVVGFVSAAASDPAKVVMITTGDVIAARAARIIRFTRFTKSNVGMAEKR